MFERGVEVYQNLSISKAMLEKVLTARRLRVTYLMTKSTVARPARPSSTDIALIGLHLQIRSLFVRDFCSCNASWGHYLIIRFRASAVFPQFSLTSGCDYASTAPCGVGR